MINEDPDSLFRFNLINPDMSSEIYMNVTTQRIGLTIHKRKTILRNLIYTDSKCIKIKCFK